MDSREPTGSHSSVLEIDREEHRGGHYGKMDNVTHQDVTTLTSILDLPSILDVRLQDKFWDKLEEEVTRI